MSKFLLTLYLALIGATSFAQLPGISTIHVPKEGDYVARNFAFKSGETLPELRLHYHTLGNPVRDAKGRVTNAVLILHGTGGSGRQFLAKHLLEGQDKTRP